MSVPTRSANLALAVALARQLVREARYAEADKVLAVALELIGEPTGETAARLARVNAARLAVQTRAVRRDLVARHAEFLRDLPASGGIV